MGNIDPRMLYRVESFRDNQWKREGFTSDPQEWLRLLSPASNPLGTEYRVCCGDKVILTCKLKRNDSA